MSEINKDNFSEHDMSTMGSTYLKVFRERNRKINDIADIDNYLDFDTVDDARPSVIGNHIAQEASNAKSSFESESVRVKKSPDSNGYYESMAIDNFSDDFTENDFSSEESNTIYADNLSQVNIYDTGASDNNLDDSVDLSQKDVFKVQNNSKDSSNTDSRYDNNAVKEGKKNASHAKQSPWRTFIAVFIVCILSVSIIILCVLNSDILADASKDTTNSNNSQVTASQNVYKTSGLSTTSTTQSTTSTTQSTTSTTESTTIITSSSQPHYETLQVGSKGDAVMKMQRRLAELGYLDKSSCTGYYGSFTKDIISIFQKKAGLKQTGIADEETLTRLYSDNAPYCR